MPESRPQTGCSTDAESMRRDRVCAWYCLHRKQCTCRWLAACILCPTGYQSVGRKQRILSSGPVTRYRLLPGGSSTYLLVDARIYYCRRSPKLNPPRRSHVPLPQSTCSWEAEPHDYYYSSSDSVASIPPSMHSLPTARLRICRGQTENRPGNTVKPLVNNIYMINKPTRSYSGMGNVSRDPRTCLSKASAVPQSMRLNRVLPQTRHQQTLPMSLKLASQLHMGAAPRVVLE